MSKEQSNRALIYESSDGGKTIRARIFGDTDNSITFNTEDSPGPLLEFIRWQEILELSRTNKALQESLNNVIMIYNLIKK